MGPKGKLWFDDDPSHCLELKVRDACKAYRHVFGEEADTVCVHPSVVEERTVIKSIVVVPRVWCLRHHYFAYKEEDERGTE